MLAAERQMRTVYCLMLAAERQMRTVYCLLLLSDLSLIKTTIRRL